MKFNLIFPNYGPLAGYMYDRTLEIYRELFGEDKIHVLLFEEFIYDREKFIRKICDLLEIDVKEAKSALSKSHERPRHTARMLFYNRIRTHLFWNVPLSRYIPAGKYLSDLLWRYIRAGKSAKVSTIDEWRDRIHNIYAADNTTLAERYNLPLEEYDYPIY